MAYSSFISDSYFIGEINIPNLTDNATSLLQARTQYEKEILISALGYKLYSLLIADSSGVTGLPTTQIYLDLVNGAEFTHESITGESILLKWEGLRNSQTQSLIAYYCFYKIVERETLHLSDVGSIVLGSAAGKRVSPIDMMCNALDRMRILYGKFPVELKSYYGTTAQKGTNFTIVNDEPSLFNFLHANSTDYPDWYFKPIWGVNVFGI